MYLYEIDLLFAVGEDLLEFLPSESIEPFAVEEDKEYLGVFSIFLTLLTSGAK